MTAGHVQHVSFAPALFVATPRVNPTAGDGDGNCAAIAGLWGGARGDGLIAAGGLCR